MEQSDIHMRSLTSSSDEEPQSDAPVAAGSSRETRRVSSFVVQYYTEIYSSNAIAMPAITIAILIYT